MRFIFYSDRAFEPWDWRNSVEKGIGGSETSHVEMAHRIAAHGHEVISYVPLPEDQKAGAEWRGTKWYHHRDVDWSLPGIWVLYRCPSMLDNFDAARTDQVKWLIFQDWYYDDLTPARVAKLQRAVILCRAHERFLLRRCPELAGLTWITRNAIKNDLIAQVEADGIPKRNPRRIMYASSPDRGLLSSLRIFERAQQIVPDLELYSTYGFDNLDKLLAGGGFDKERRDKEECLKLIEITGATPLGRISQNQLYYEWLKTGLTTYITDFFETGWITGLEAMALGAIPVFSPVYAQGENCKWGVQVVGNPRRPETIAEAAAEVVRLARNQDLQESIRSDMMADARAKWDWEQFVSLKPHENWLEAAEQDTAAMAQRVVSGPGSSVPLCDNEDERDCRQRWLHLEAADCFLDVGAADGSWSVAAAEQGARVYAFEPNPRTRLREVIQSRGLTGRVDAIQAFVSNRNGRTGHGVPEMTLDTFALSRGLLFCDFVKIDVEGLELSVLAGMTGMLRRFRPRLMIEVHTETVPGLRVELEQVTEFLDSLNLDYRYESVERTYQGRRYYHLYAESDDTVLAPTGAPQEAA